MLSKDNFTRDHIENLRRVSGNDPALLERTVYAFGLLEAIRRAGWSEGRRFGAGTSKDTIAEWLGSVGIKY